MTYPEPDAPDTARTTFLAVFTVVAATVCLIWCNHQLSLAKAAPPEAPHAIQADASFQGYTLRGIKVHDGDTIEADIVLPWRVALAGERIRCAGYDAWEVTTTRKTVVVTEEELAKGRAARDALITLLDDADARLLPIGTPRDVYGRVLGRLVIVQGGKLLDVAAWMQANGYVRVPNAQAKHD